MASSQNDTSAESIAGATRIDCTPEARITKSLLGYGVIVGPFYVLVSVIQGLLTPGFDFARDSWSLLSLGPAGWVHVTVFVLTGLMLIGAAIGLHRHITAGPARTAWVYLVVYGVLLMGAGALQPDAADAAFTWHGAMHLLCGGLGFIAFAVWSFLVARRLAARSRRLAVLSAAVGAFLLVGSVCIAAGSGSVTANLVFTLAVVVSWAWLSIVSVIFYREAAVEGRIEVPVR
nr:DUF998 domain-containing protein [Planctomonas sp. JC2975]